MNVFSFYLLQLIGIDGFYLQRKITGSIG